MDTGREVPLSQGKVALVDDEDFARVSQYRWHAKAPRPASYRHSWYAFRNVGGRHLSLHAFILQPSAGLIVDHIDGNGLQNCRFNLRLASFSENGQNTRKFSGCSSPYKGVCWNNEKQKFQVRLSVNGRVVHLGWFTDEIEGANHYDFAAAQCFGPFARLNFPLVAA